VIQFFEAFQTTFPDARTASHEYLEGDRGTVVVGFRVTGTGRASGAEAEMAIWQVWEIRDQDNLTVTRVTEFMSRRDALENRYGHGLETQPGQKRQVSRAAAAEAEVGPGDHDRRGGDEPAVDEPRPGLVLLAEREPRLVRPRALTVGAREVDSRRVVAAAPARGVVMRRDVQLSGARRARSAP
jgi:hypothetical protein